MFAFGLHLWRTWLEQVVAEKGKRWGEEAAMAASSLGEEEEARWGGEVAMAASTVGGKEKESWAEEVATLAHLAPDAVSAPAASAPSSEERQTPPFLGTSFLEIWLA
jgi:hypothetical protein